MTKNNPPKNITNSSQTPSDTLSGSLKISNNRLPHLIFTRSQNMHLFFVESGLLVLSDTINRLNLVKMLLQSVEKTHETFGDNIEVAAKITFNKLGSNILDVLNSLDVTINVKEDSPFIYNFLFLGAFLKLPVNTTKFFGAIIELLYNELRIQYGKKLFLGYGYDESYELALTEDQKTEMLWTFQDDPPIRDEQLLIGQIYGFPKPEYGQIDVDYRTGRASWLLVDALIRIRAQWDKLIKLFLLENYFQIKPKNKLTQCLKQIERIVEERENLSQLQHHCLETILSLGRSIDELRVWRDNDIHSISPSVLGVLETRSSSSSLSDLWDFLLTEHNKVREAFIAAIGVVCLGKRISSNSILVNWPIPKHYPDINNEDDVKLLTELCSAMEYVVKLRILCEQDPALKSTNFLLDAELKAINLARKLYRFNKPANAP